ncbi:MAG TPA: biopolymer transporter ExbD [Firmicutes bacterium]|jgi:biopolymer transport protein ExbD|nr:biopolymer transporter ExbD [Bacillota bacterium]
MIFKRTLRRESRVDIVPLIDIIFFLMAFFMFFTTFRTGISGIPIELPQSQQAVTLEEQRVIVTVNPQGEIFLTEPDPISLEKLTATLEPMVARRPDLLVVINADTQVKYGRLVEVMDAITAAGVSLPALGVEKSASVRGQKK